MKKGTMAVLFGGALACAGALTAWLAAPGSSRKEQRAPFQNRYFAHRGLYDPDAGIPENSLAAFRAAAEHGYGAEMDVRITRDGVAVISHDACLERMCASPLVIEDSDYDDIKDLTLAGTGEHIPLFRDALEILMGAGVPAVVEIKAMGRNVEGVCSAALEIMDAFDGQMCVESFDPWAVQWFRRHAPDLLRGQLITQRDDLKLPPWEAWPGVRGLFNFMGRPQFIAHRTGKKALTVRLAERMGAMRVCWTAHDRSQERHNDAVIFEHFRPPLRYL